MRICQCTLRVCNKNGPCDVQNAVEKANRTRMAKGKAPLTNTERDIQRGVNMFYAEHKKEIGKAPCRGCEPLVINEVAAILSGQACEGPVPMREAAHATA